MPLTARMRQLSAPGPPLTDLVRDRQLGKLPAAFARPCFLLGAVGLLIGALWLTAQLAYARPEPGTPPRQVAQSQIWDVRSS